MSFSALIAPARLAMRMPTRIVRVQTPFRTLHASSSVLKKKSSAAVEDDPFAEEEDLEDDLDLFSGTTSTEAPIPVAPTDNQSAIGRRVERAAIIERIKTLSLQPRAELEEPLKHMRIGDLRKVISFAESREELEVVERVLKAWRYFDKRITQKTMEALVGRSAHLGYPELALRLYADPVAYGLPMMTPSQVLKLHQSYARVATPEPLPPLRLYQALTYESAIYRLVAVSKSIEASSPQKTETGEDAASSSLSAKLSAAVDEILVAGMVRSEIDRETRARVGKQIAALKAKDKAYKDAIERLTAANEAAQSTEGSSNVVPPPTKEKKQTGNQVYKALRTKKKHEKMRQVGLERKAARERAEQKAKAGEPVVLDA